MFPVSVKLLHEFRLEFLRLNRVVRRKELYLIVLDVLEDKYCSVAGKIGGNKPQNKLISDIR